MVRFERLPSSHSAKDYKINQSRAFLEKKKITCLIMDENVAGGKAFSKRAV